MTTEEKAKAYDKALEKAKYLHEAAANGGYEIDVKTFECLFPELKKSEDERIRKALIEYFNNANKSDENPLYEYGIYTDKVIIWLEKQCQVKESDISQHENKYKEALERMKSWVRGEHPECFTEAQKAAEFIFPELKESEDEKIKGAIIDHLKDNNLIEWAAWLEKQGEHKDYYTKQELIDMGFSFTLNGDIVTPDEMMEDLKKYLAWVEKQGEQKQTMAIPKWKYKKDSTPLLQDSIILNKYGCVAKSPSGAIVSDVWVLDYNELAKLPKEKLEQESTDKVEPKFKVGDWIAREGFNTAFIINIDNDRYEVELIDGNKAFPHIDYIDRIFHLWTIEDAKDGDVLATVDDKYPFIYKGCLDLGHPDSPVAYCGIDDEGNFRRGGDNFDHWWTDTKVQPAVKEQCELLFQEIRKAGYEWDAEKLELKKIDNPSEPDLVGMKELGKVWDEKQDPILQRLDRIYDLLLHKLNEKIIINNPFPRLTETPYKPEEVWYGSSAATSEKGGEE